MGRSKIYSPTKRFLQEKKYIKISMYKNYLYTVRENFKPIALFLTEKLQFCQRWLNANPKMGPKYVNISQILFLIKLVPRIHFALNFTSRFSLESKKFWGRIFTIWRRHDVIWTSWRCRKSNTIYSSKNVNVSKKIWLDGMKYCYKCKDLFHYFRIRGQCSSYLYLLPRKSNLKMIQFWQDFGKFWAENTDTSTNSTGKA